MVPTDVPPNLSANLFMVKYLIYFIYFLIINTLNCKNAQVYLNY